MAPPIYFLADRWAANLIHGERVRTDVLEAAGLGDVLRDVRFRGQLAYSDFKASGPGGKSGLLLCASGRGGRIPDRFGYHPDFQEWAEIGPGLWLGFEPQHPPTPEDLERRELFKGFNVKIGEHVWTVPIIRRIDGTTELPCRFGWTRDQRFESVIKAEYREIWEALAPACALFVGKNPDMKMEEVVELALRGLALNYRIGRAEQTAFGPIDSLTWEPIVAAMADLDWAKAEEEAAKKKSGESV